MVNSWEGLEILLFCKVSTFLFSGYLGIFPRGSNAWSVNLTTYSHLVSMIGMCGSIPVHPPIELLLFPSSAHKICFVIAWIFRVTDLLLQFCRIPMLYHTLNHLLHGLSPSFCIKNNPLCFNDRISLSSWSNYS
jgi:hypothetical protein